MCPPEVGRSELGTHLVLIRALGLRVSCLSKEGFGDGEPRASSPGFYEVALVGTIASVAGFTQRVERMCG